MQISSPCGGVIAQRQPVARTYRLRSWVCRTVLFLIVALVVLVSAGAIYQTIATQLDKRAYPPPGQLVDVGGHRLHIACSGSGSPTVILEAAADMMSADWGWVQPEVAKTTRVCAYDRAGMGWSDPAPQPRDARQITNELHLLLKEANIPGPYVLVGHSVGGLYVRLYADQHPNDVVGMVLLDPGHPDMTTRIPALQAHDRADAQLVSIMGLLAHVGVPRLFGIGQANTKGLPAQQGAEAGAFYATAQHWDTISRLIAAKAETDTEVRGTGRLGDRPLVVLSASTAWLTPGAPTDETRHHLNSLHAELATLSSNGIQREVPGATHGSLVHERDHAQAASDAIRQVVEALRADQSLVR